LYKKRAADMKCRRIRMIEKEDLFKGEPAEYGGLDIESDLLEICPVKFKKNHYNPWLRYAEAMCCCGADISKWRWKSGNEKKREKQWICLQAIFRSPDLSQNDKNALAAWMLSEMLSGLPKYLPLKGR
jgi:hypothetical protein